MTGYRVSSNFKYRTRKLFQVAFKLRFLPGISMIKVKFPKFDPKSPIHWFNLCDRLNEMLVKDEPTTPAQELHELLCKLPIQYRWTHYDYLCGVSTSVSFKGIKLGTIGWSDIHKRWYCSFGRQGSNKYTNGLNQAWELLKQLNYSTINFKPLEVA